MRKNVENILMSVLVVVVIVAALGFILQTPAMISTALVFLTLVVGAFAALQIYDFLAKDTVGENADKKRNKMLFLYMVVAVVLFLALLAATIFHLYGKLF